MKKIVILALFYVLYTTIVISLLRFTGIYVYLNVIESIDVYRYWCIIILISIVDANMFKMIDKNMKDSVMTYDLTNFLNAWVAIKDFEGSIFS